jgi:hypothetical protein
MFDSNMNNGTPGAASTLNASFNDVMRYTNARNTLGTLRGLADYVAGMRGRRKAVVFFSEGIDYDVTNPIQNQYASDIREETRQAIDAATSTHHRRPARPLDRNGGRHRDGRHAE